MTLALLYAGTTYWLTRNTSLLGRSASCSIVLAEPSISRQHCQVRLEGDCAFVTDLGSQNGTFVNELRVTDGEQGLTPGDFLRLGTVELQVQQMVISAPPAHSEVRVAVPTEEATAEFHRSALSLEEPSGIFVSGGTQKAEEGTG